MNQSNNSNSITASLTDNYINKILPYQIIVESITLQNREIYELEKKYISMRQFANNIQNVSEADEQLLKTRQKKQILERKMFMEQALVTNQLKYKTQYEKRKNQLQEEIHLLKSDIQMKGGNKINIFMNLNEGILTHLLEDNKGNQEIMNNIKYWKEAYERSKRIQN